jgi:hypothetical protein
MTQRFASGLTVRYRVGDFDVATDTWTFREGVVATFDLTTLHSNVLTVHAAPGQEQAEATGAVELDDPAGFVTADAMTFTWLAADRHATARKAMIHIANVMIEASRAELTPAQWDLYDVYASNCRENPPLFAIHTSHLRVYPGKRGVIRNPTLEVLGYRIITLPDQTFNLNSKTQGFQYPSLSYHQGQGVGLSAKEGYLLTPTTNVAATYGAIHGSLPSYGAVITNSLVPDAKDNGIITPASDFSERFRYGYLENIDTLTPGQEARYIAASRNSVSLSSAWNSFVVDRPDPIAYTKPVEGIYEYGGQAEGVGYIGQARFQQIQQYRQEFHDRVVLVGTLALKPHHITPNLETMVRLETEHYVGNDFGWVRGLAGLAYSPFRQLTVAGGAFASASYGDPLYPIDELYAKDGGMVRSDLNLGATRIGYLLKWDTHLGWFDREYEITQVAGCLEPFLLVREFPRAYDLGIRFRLDPFYDVLRHRSFQRPAEPLVISHM